MHSIILNYFFNINKTKIILINIFSTKNQLI
jgi:hypothetical protein